MAQTNQLTANSSITQSLIDLGLGENDAKMYEILLANPDATIPFLKQKSPFSRTMLYYILESLEGYELLEKKETGKKTVYNAAPPEKLEEFIRDQEKELQRQKSMLKEVIVDLGSMYRLAHNKPGVRFYEGIDGVHEVTFDSLKATSTIYTFADTIAMEKYMGEINREYVKQRILKKIPKKIIAVDVPFVREHYRNINPEFTEVKLMPGNSLPFKTGTQIYNNTVSYSTLTDKKMIGVIIEDENISQMHRSVFEYVWNSLPKFMITGSKPPSSNHLPVVLNPN